MSEVLRRHVVDNIWCTPDQDYQSIYRPKKITRTNGVFKYVRTLRERYRLPKDDVQYHVYQIGQVPPRLLGWVNEDHREWVRVSDLMVDHPLIVDVYTVSGQYLPRFETFVRWTTTRNLLVAIPRLSGDLDLNDRDVFIRFYTNAYYASDRFTGDTPTYCHGQWVTTEAERIAFQAHHNTYKDRPEGAVKCIVDGTLIKVPSSMTIPLGSWAEFVFDASVRSVVRVPYNELMAFDSVLDGVRKYLLHLPKEEQSTIHYKDDLDIHLWKVNTASLQVGTYYHQNDLSSIRMLTHQDYALPVSTLAQYTTDLEYWQNLSEVELEVWVRHSGYERPLVYEHHRIHELYSLEDGDITAAMLGTVSGVAEWRAEVLETSAYPKMMRTGSVDSLSRTTILDGLGYNAASGVLCPNPNPTRSYLADVVADRPFACQQECLALEYDADGYLLHSEHVTDEGALYRTHDTDAAWVEFYPGPVGPIAQRFYDVPSVTVDSSVAVRLYKCPKVGGVANEEWVTADPADVDITTSGESTTYTWANIGSQWATVILTDEGVTTYGQSYPATRDIVKLTLGTGVSRGGVWGFEPAHIPFDHVQVVMNGRSLVESIDYTIRWPEVIIHTSQGLDTSTTMQRVQILMMGLPEDVRTYTPTTDIGFVVNGRLSDDHRYQVRDDRVNRVVVDGRVLDQSDVHFAEDGVLSGAEEHSGRPYSVRVPPTPLALSDGRDREQYRLEARDLDTRVSTWLSTLYPGPEPETTSLFPSKYVLISPFLSSILHDMLSGIIDTTNWSPDDVTDIWLNNAFGDYLYLLDYDPAYTDLDPHVTVHPHGQGVPVTVSRVQHTILVRANHLFLGQRVETHELLRVGA